MNPLVSVVVATYRRDESLKNALLSLLKQDYEYLEIILVDDNADAEYNRRVKDIVEECRNENSAVNINLIVNNPNLGSAKTRNKGIAAAKGEYVTFLDDDDVYLPQKVSSQVEFMLGNDADYSVTDLELFNSSDKLIDRRTRGYIEKTDSKSLLGYHFKHHITGTDTMMFKRDYLEKIGGFDAIDVGDEFYLMKKAIEAGGKFAYLNRCDVKAYIHTGDGGLSSGQGKIDGENQLYEFKKKHFDKMDNKTVRYIKMRHFAVLAFAYLRMKKLHLFLFNSFKSFFSSPFECVKLFLTLK